MKDNKTMFMTFLPYDYTGIETELNKQSQEGWLLTGIHKSSWTFQKCEPGQYKYCVTYVPDASFYNPEPTEHQVILDEFCSDTGWSKVAESNYLQIYASENMDILPIDTDEELKFETIKRSMRKHYLPGRLLISALAVLYLFLSYYVYFNQAAINGVPLLVTAKDHFADLLLFSGLTVMGPLRLINYLIWALRTKHFLQTGETVTDCRPHAIADNVFDIVLIIFIGLYFYNTVNGPQELTDFVNTLLFATLIGPLSYLTSRIMKYAGFSKKANIIISFGTGILLSLFLAPFLTACLIARGVLI